MLLETKDNLDNLEVELHGTSKRKLPEHGTWQLSFAMSIVVSLGPLVSPRISPYFLVVSEMSWHSTENYRKELSFCC